MCSKSSVVALFERNKDFLPQVTVYLIITPFLFQKLLQGVDLNKEIDGGHSGVRKLSVFPSVFNNLMTRVLTDTSIIRTPLYYGEFVWSQKCQKSYILYLYNTDTSVKRTLGSVHLMSVLKRFDCNDFCTAFAFTVGAILE